MNGFAPRTVSFLRMSTSTLDANAHFARDILGLEKTFETNVEVGFRSDERARSLVFCDVGHKGAVGLELRDEPELDRIAVTLRAGGYACEDMASEECARRLVRRAIRTCDASGNCIEFVARSQLSARRIYPPRDTGVIGLGAVGLRSVSIERDVAFWTDVLGARVSDRVGDITYLRFDDAHHRVALYPSDRNGLLYASFGVASHDHLMRNCYFLQERQVRIVHGPGLETASGRTFVRFAGPDGQIFAFEYDAAPVAPNRHARQFSLEPLSLCAWGSPCRDINELSAAVAA